MRTARADAGMGVLVIEDDADDVSVIVILDDSETF